MKCDQCGQEATVHELRVVAGKSVERHLCERCAQQAGLLAGTLPLAVVLENLVKTMQPAAKGGALAAMMCREACPACGTTPADIRQTGLLGCPECYRAFEGLVIPLLERAHEGATQHVGRVPRRMLTRGELEAWRQAREEALRAELRAALEREQYEQAASIRDQLRRLGAGESPSEARDPSRTGGEV